MSLEDCHSVAGQGAPDAVDRAVDEAIENGIGSAKKAPGSAGGRPRQRLAAARKQQGISQPNMARRLRVDVAKVIEQEKETADLFLSTIYAWQKILNVPIADLLVDDDASLSTPLFERARMVELMKTAAAILEKANSNSLRRTVTMLIEQLVEIMPELRDVAAWNTVEQRRMLDEYGRTVELQLPDDLIRRTIR
jgi:transcriptional regulator with XRE-family HTH domain